MTIKNLKTASPVEIDTLLADLDYDRWTAFSRAASYRQAAQRAMENRDYDYRLRRYVYRPDLLRGSELEKLAEEQDEIVAAKVAEMAPLNREFNRRGGWNRAFLVVTSGIGHVHSSQSCHTCYPTTQFHWVTDYSGHDEDEIVGDAGERACTICYPSAPAEVLNRPTKMFTKDEQAKQAARDERAAKKAAAEAAMITDPITGKVLFKTERGATNEIASGLDDWLRYEQDEYRDKAFAICQAVAAKRGVEVDGLWDELLAKAEKKFRREAIKRVKECLATKGRTPAHYDMSDPALWYASYRKIALEEGLI